MQSIPVSKAISVSDHTICSIDVLIPDVTGLEGKVSRVIIVPGKAGLED